MLTPSSEEGFVNSRISKRADEFAHFNYNIYQQIFNPEISADERKIFAKIFRSNGIEGMEKFKFNDTDYMISDDEIDIMVDESIVPAKQYVPWVDSHPGPYDLHKETLLHFPYDKFSDLLKSISSHVDDIQEIWLSVYRLAEDSEIVHLLVYLMKMGVNVTIMIEVNAKGNEFSNISYARQLKEMGAQVIVADSPKKNHAKFIHLIWMDNSHTTMVMTGNLNEVTADIYEDYCMISSDPDITEPMREMIVSLFSTMRAKVLTKSNTIFFTQHHATSTLVRNIREQTLLGGNGYIFIKCNSFTDPTFMSLLENAGNKGVHVDIVCRGECCFKPISENVVVHRFIHKYLEHSRVYRFGIHDPKVYIGSLDIATHKLFGRFELICDIHDSDMKNRIVAEMDNMLHDKTRRHYFLLSDGNKHQYVPYVEEE